MDVIEAVAVVMYITIGTYVHIIDGVVAGKFADEHKPVECVLMAYEGLIRGGSLRCVDPHGHVVVRRKVGEVSIAKRT